MTSYMIVDRQQNSEEPSNPVFAFYVISYSFLIKCESENYSQNDPKIAKLRSPCHCTFSFSLLSPFPVSSFSSTLLLPYCRSPWFLIVISPPLLCFLSFPSNFFPPLLFLCSYTPTRGHAASLFEVYWSLTIRHTPAR
jgi:hypothetical protein